MRKRMFSLCSQSRTVTPYINTDSIRKEKESGINQKIQIASTQPTLVRDVAKQVENTAQQDLPTQKKTKAA